MLTIDDMRLHLEDVYYPNAKFEVHDSRWEGPYIRILYELPDNFEPGETTTLGVNSFLPPFRTEDDFDLWLQWRMWRIEGHEARERLQIDGMTPFNPHAENANGLI
jgi:hypothetical protein